ncbi:MAG: tRNA adenosine(34) deaminase TadA [Oscillospiraceae bacterium]|jgi:tRNA(adenine34) deaminase|nr:tRNA adenosine(34) deaminase TadA [Oscillospiraceae bacterium]
MIFDKSRCIAYNFRKARARSDEDYMRMALALAHRAENRGEVPVGAVLVRNGSVIAAGFNRREGRHDALAHAEAEAIRAGCKAVHGWRLDGCTLYVTLEPCPMCAGAIVNSRAARVVFGAYDPKAGAAGSVLDLFAYPLNHRPKVIGGVLAEECGKILTNFFRVRRGRTTSAGRRS